MIHRKRPIPEMKRLTQLRGEAYFLAGRHGRIAETLRLFRIALEFVRGFRALQFLGRTVTVFGSARIPETSPWYEQARQIGARLAKAGYTVMTGGGPGIMEAANRGAFEAGGLSVGCNIVLPFEQRPNPYLSKAVTFYYFFVRKVMLVKYSQAYVILPGGFGTLDELSEALTLIQTGKLYDFPVILVDSQYWAGLFAWLRGPVLASGAIKADDLRLITVVDTVDEAMSIIESAPWSR